MTSVRLRDVAAKAGVSVTTVSRVLNGSNGTYRISEQCAAHVREIAAELKYRPNSAARAMVSQRTRNIGVLTVNSANNPYNCPEAYFTIIGVNIALQQAGYSLTLIRLADVEDDRNRAIQEHCVDGLIVANAVPSRYQEVATSVSPRCVWVDADVWQETCCLRRDERQAGRLAAEMLLEGGYKKIVFAGPDLEHPLEHFSHAQRLEGVRQVCRDAESVNLSFDHDRDSLRDRMSAGWGIVADDVNWARYAQRLAGQERVRPGSDFGLSCCDSAPELIWLWPELSRVDFDRLGLGKLAAQMLLAMLDGDEPPKSKLIASKAIHGTTSENHRRPPLRP